MTNVDISINEQLGFLYSMNYILLTVYKVFNVKKEI